MRRNKNYYRSQGRRVQVQVVPNWGTELQRVLRECVAMPYIHIIRELEIVGIR